MLPELKRFLEDNGLQTGQRNDPTIGPGGPYNHGAGGLFSAAGQDNAVFSAIIMPVGGLIDVLPVRNAQDDSGQSFGGNDQEFFSTITGVTQGAAETFANQPTEKCADGARAGLMKVCTLVSGFARYRFSPSSPVSLFDAGRRRDVADPDTLRLMNLPMMRGLFGVPTTVSSEENWLMNEFARRSAEMAVSISRFMVNRTYIGSPSNNSGERRDIAGIDLHVASGNKRDAYTMNLCTAMDSEIFDFGYDKVNGSGRDIQKYAEHMLAKLDWKVVHQGLGSRWDGVIVMRPEQWDEVVKTIQLRQYLDAIETANAMAGTTKITLNAEAAQIRAAQDDMRENLYWPLRGRRVPVVLDDGITEVTPNETGSLRAGQYAADIYFIPLRVLGNIPVTYWKYFNHDNTNSATLAQMAGAQATMTTDGGQFRWYFNFKNGCLDWTVDWSPRLLMRTPQIAGRIQKVAYEPLSHFQSFNPSSSYFVNGGRISGPTQNYYTEWSPTTPVSLS